MATDAALSSRLLSKVSSKQTDTDLLMKLSEVSVNLQRLRQDEATATTELRQGRARVVHIEALLRADSLALASLRNRADADRVAVGVLDDAVAGGQRAFESANEGAARGSDAIAPLLERLSKAIAELESRAADLRSRLSPTTAHALDALFRKKVLPLVSALDRGACGVCHLRLPTALTSSTALRSAVHRCPHCKRILVPARLDGPAKATKTGSSDRDG